MVKGELGFSKTANPEGAGVVLVDEGSGRECGTELVGRG
jgi:hypothetical protein